MLRMELDVTRTLKWLRESEQLKQVTLTHCTVKALALAFSKTPELRGFLKWGNVSVRYPL